MPTPTQKPGEATRSEIMTPAAEVGIVPMDLTIRAKLSIMMFLQYFAWGAWFVTMGTYLSKSLECPDDQLGWAYAASPIGAMIAPFFVGMIADRFFATQHILAALHLLGAVLLFVAASVMGVYPRQVLRGPLLMVVIMLLLTAVSQFGIIPRMETYRLAAGGVVGGDEVSDDHNRPRLVGGSVGVAGEHCGGIRELWHPVR